MDLLLPIAAVAALGYFIWSKSDSTSSSSKSAAWAPMTNASPLNAAALDGYAYMFDQAKKAGSTGAVAVKFKVRRESTGTTRDLIGLVQDVRVVDGKRLWRVTVNSVDAFGAAVTDPAPGTEFILFDSNLFA